MKTITINKSMIYDRPSFIDLQNRAKKANFSKISQSTKFYEHEEKNTFIERFNQTWEGIKDGNRYIVVLHFMEKVN